MRITDIQRFCMRDGPGIRTTVFFKGCPLKCIWCHNPETQSPQKELFFYPNRCIGCGACAAVCPQGAHRMLPSHTVDRTLCIGCGACAACCPTNALQLTGRDCDAEELLPLLLRDRAFYGEKGGVTLSGGECLYQASACAELLKLLKKEGVHTAVDTCGAVPREVFEKVLPYTDLFLYDLKAMDEETHLRYTGKSNRLILENLRFLDSVNANVEIRIPHIPTCNDDQIDKIRGFLGTLRNPYPVTVLPYNRYAASKYAALGRENTMPDDPSAGKDSEG